MSTGLIANDEKVSTWLMRQDSKERITGALGGFLEPDMFLAQIVIALGQPAAKGQDWGPRDCTPQSQFECAMKIAALALLPSLQQVALIPRKTGQNSAVLDVMVQWQGYKALMLRVPEVLDVTVGLVHIKDGYTFQNEVFTHSYDPFDVGREFRNTGDLKGGYARVDFRDGRPPKYHFAPASYIEKCRKCAQTQVVWNAWFEQQALKTVLRSLWGRRVINFDPATASRLKVADELDDRLLQNDPTRALPAPQSVDSFVTGVIDGVSHPQIAEQKPAKRTTKPKAEPKQEQQAETPEPTQEQAREAQGDVEGNAELTPLEELARHIEEFDDADRLADRKKVILGSENPFKLSAAEKGKAFPMFDNAIAALRQKGG